MALSILNNIASIAAQNQLTVTNKSLNTALFQLSSGSRINSGADDAAGLAIADGLHANITALTQSARNANDGVGELQVADGSLAQVTTLLNRAITLATESATGTVSNSQRVALDAEYTAIKAEIDRVGSKTNYNGGQVFTANTLNIFLSDAGASSNSTIGVTTGVLSSGGIGLGGATQATATLTAAAGAGNTQATDTLTGGTIVNAGTGAGTLTVGTTIVDTDSATIGGQTYVFKTALTGAANEVLIGGSNANALINLKKAVNLSGVAGTDYGTGTTLNTSATAGAISATTLAFAAKVAGTAGNVVSTTTGGTTSFAAGTFAGGTAGSTVTLGGTTYTFVGALSSTPTANEVLGGTLAVGLANLVLAVNGGATAGTNYGAGTVKNANVQAGPVGGGGTTILFTAVAIGAAGTGQTLSASAGSVATFSSPATTGGITGAGAPNASNGDTIDVGGQTYTFKTALTAGNATANEVLIGASESASLANLTAAVNNTTGSGTTYGSATVANANATAVNSPTSIVFTATAAQSGTTGNTLASTVTGTANTFGGTTFAGGAAAVANDLLNIADATATLATVNNAIQTIASLRGTIGATVNRLQSAAGVITNQVQNLTGAEDGVRAADIPSTVAALAKYTILEQTGISALAQANQQQQLVLKLLQ